MSTIALATDTTEQDKISFGEAARIADELYESIQDDSKLVKLYQWKIQKIAVSQITDIEVKEEIKNAPTFREFAEARMMCKPRPYLEKRLLALGQIANDGKDYSQIATIASSFESPNFLKWGQNAVDSLIYKLKLPQTSYCQTSKENNAAAKKARKEIKNYHKTHMKLGSKISHALFF